MNFFVERIGHLRPVNRQATVIGAGKLCVCLFGELDNFVGIIDGEAGCVYECIELQNERHIRLRDRCFKIEVYKLRGSRIVINNLIGTAGSFYIAASALG